MCKDVVGHVGLPLVHLSHLRSDKVGEILVPLIDAGKELHLIRLGLHALLVDLLLLGLSAHHWFDSHRSSTRARVLTAAAAATPFQTCWASWKASFAGHPLEVREAVLDFQQAQAHLAPLLALVGLDCPEALGSLQLLVGLEALAILLDLLDLLDLLALAALARAQVYQLTLLLVPTADPIASSKDLV